MTLFGFSQVFHLLVNCEPSLSLHVELTELQCGQEVFSDSNDRNSRIGRNYPLNIALATPLNIVLFHELTDIPEIINYISGQLIDTIMKKIIIGNKKEPLPPSPPHSVMQRENLPVA